VLGGVPIVRVRLGVEDRIRAPVAEREAPLVRVGVGLPVLVEVRGEMDVVDEEEAPEVTVGDPEGVTEGVIVVVVLNGLSPPPPRENVGVGVTGPFSEEVDEVEGEAPKVREGVGEADAKSEVVSVTVGVEEGVGVCVNVGVGEGMLEGEAPTVSEAVCEAEYSVGLN